MRLLWLRFGEIEADSTRVPLPLILARGNIGFDMDHLPNLQFGEPLRCRCVLARNLLRVSSFLYFKRHSRSRPRPALSHTALQREHGYYFSCKLDYHILVNKWFQRNGRLAFSWVTARKQSYVIRQRIFLQYPCQNRPLRSSPRQISCKRTRSR